MLAPDRNLALELVRVTESAAMGAGRWVGRGDKNAADQAAVDAMRSMLDSVAMDGVVVIGEGEKDEAPMLYNGESVGNSQGPQVDVAVDPLEGTRLCALGQPNAIAGATSPSRIRSTFAPASRSSAIKASWRSRSRTTTEISRGVTPFASATRSTFSVGDASMSIASAASGPQAILSM